MGSIEATSWRGPEPVRETAVVMLCAGVLLVVLYSVVGCRREWISIVGLTLDIGAAAGLVVLDSPSWRPRFYADDLEELYDDLGMDRPPEIHRDTDAWEILRSSMQEHTDLPDAPAFAVTDERELRIDGGDDYESRTIDLIIVQRHLEEQIERERGRLRKFALYVLTAGFCLQLVGEIVVDAPVLVC